MLVLSRQRGERIVIDDIIIVTVLEITGDTVRLGFEAPEEVQIDREEVYRERLQTLLDRLNSIRKKAR